MWNTEFTYLYVADKLVAHLRELINWPNCLFYSFFRYKRSTTQKTLNGLNSFLWRGSTYMITYLHFIVRISFACFSGWDVFMMSVLLRSDFPPKILSCTKKRLGVVIACGRQSTISLQMHTVVTHHFGVSEFSRILKYTDIFRQLIILWNMKFITP